MLKRLILLAFLIFFSLTVYSYLIHTCTCYDNELTVTARTEEQREEDCGRGCGGLTNCPCTGTPPNCFPDVNAVCSDCCDAFCSGSGLSAGSERDGCVDSCIKTCESKKAGMRMYEAAKLISIVFAAVIFAICGIMYILSDDPKLRHKLRGCLLYSIFCLILIGIAVPIVELLYTITLPAGVTPPSARSCADQVGNAIASCWDGRYEPVSGTYWYPCRIVDISGCPVDENFGESDVESYLNSIGRNDITGTAVGSLDHVNWLAGSVSGATGSVCIIATSARVDVYVTSADRRCRSKAQIDSLSPQIYNCYDDPSEDDRLCAQIDAGGWPADVGVQKIDVMSYIKYNTGEDPYSWIDLNSGIVIDNTWTGADTICIRYDTFLDNEVHVEKSSESAECP